MTGATVDAIDLQPFLARCHIRRYAARAAIIRQGDVANELYYIVSGSVSVMLSDEVGREIVLAYLNPGEFFGEIGLFAKGEARSALVRARTECQIAQIGYARLREQTDLYAHLLIAMTSQMANRLCATNRKLKDLASLDVHGRVARTLLELAEQPDAEIVATGTTVRVTRLELARLVGCSREMVGKVLKDMENDRHILIEGRNVLLIGVTPRPAKRATA